MGREFGLVINECKSKAFIFGAGSGPRVSNLEGIEVTIFSKAIGSQW